MQSLHAKAITHLEGLLSEAKEQYNKTHESMRVGSPSVSSDHPDSAVYWNSDDLWVQAARIYLLDATLSSLKNGFSVARQIKKIEDQVFQGEVPNLYTSTRSTLAFVAKHQALCSLRRHLLPYVEKTYLAVSTTQVQRIAAESFADAKVAYELSSDQESVRLYSPDEVSQLEPVLPPKE